MIDTTVVAWKNADTSRDALEWALRHHQQGSILIAHVADRNIALVESFAADSRAAQARVELMEVAERVRSENPDLTVHSELLHGDPVEALVRLSGPNTLAVVGSERHKAALPARSWSMAAKLAGSARGPVAVIPSNPPAGSGVVVGVDDPSDSALRFAAEQAQRTGEMLHAVRAWQGPPGWAGDGRTDPEYFRSLELMYTDILDDALEDIADEHPGVQIRRSVVHGEPREVLLKASEGASMLVVGNRGLRGTKRFFLGSVSHAVVLASRIPTVVVNDS